MQIVASDPVNDEKYKDWVLVPYVQIFIDAVGPIFMDENTRRYGDHLLDIFHEGEYIHHIDWPARSPDMDPRMH